MSLAFAPELLPTPTVNIALIGQPKTGKSTAAASAPAPILYLNADLPTATRFARRRHEGVREVVIPVESGIPKPMKVLTGITHEVLSGSTEFKTVVVDPVGELHRLLLEEQSNRSTKPTLPTYGDVSIYVERFCRAMCEAPVNTVLVFHDLPIVDEATGEGIVLPFAGTTGKGGIALGRKVLGLVDVIGYTGIDHRQDGPHYMAQLTTNKGRPGGDRFGVLANEQGQRELDLSEWVATIIASEQETTTTTKKGSK